MQPVAEGYASGTPETKSFNIIQPVYACSPPIPTSEETITDIQIYSSKPYNKNYSTDDNVADIFDIFVFYQGKIFEMQELPEFLASNPTVPNQMSMIPTSPPSSVQEISFTIKYVQKRSRT